MAHNVLHVCDVAPRLTEPRGHVAERRAAAPRSPRRLPRRRCTYELLYAVALCVRIFILSFNEISHSSRWFVGERRLGACAYAVEINHESSVDYRFIPEPKLPTE